jgi:hypothetical protein
MNYNINMNLTTHPLQFVPLPLVQAKIDDSFGNKSFNEKAQYALMRGPNVDPFPLLQVFITLVLQLFWQ